MREIQNYRPEPRPVGTFPHRHQLLTDSVTGLFRGIRRGQPFISENPQVFRKMKWQAVDRLAKTPYASYLSIFLKGHSITS